MARAKPIAANTSRPDTCSPAAATTTVATSPRSSGTAWRVQACARAVTAGSTVTWPRWRHSRRWPARDPTIRPSRIRTTRSAASATSGSWVTRMMVWPPWCSRRISSITSWPPSESSAPVGSSASSRVGSLASARAMASRWRWPPDSTPGTAEALSPMPSRSSRSRARVSAIFRLRPAMIAGRATFSSTVMPSSRLKNWKTRPTWLRRIRASSSSVRPVTSSPATVISPSSAISSPATRFSSVDLPQPEGPIRATNSPAPTVRFTPRNARTGAFSASNVLRTPRTASAGRPGLELFCVIVPPPGGSCKRKRECPVP